MHAQLQLSCSAKLNQIIETDDNKKKTTTVLFS